MATARFFLIDDNLVYIKVIGPIEEHVKKCRNADDLIRLLLKPSIVQLSKLRAEELSSSDDESDRKTAEDYWRIVEGVSTLFGIPKESLLNLQEIPLEG